ncbi:hypothetical protein [Dolichospermum circinale]|nr:hypothetical protein [Dolichospermum circinale]
MEVGKINPWLFPVEPYPGESLSHFLGRYGWCHRCFKPFGEMIEHQNII